MSRIGKQPITIPAGVTATIDESCITVKGPKGELRQALHRQVPVVQQDGIITISIIDEADKSQRALWGLYGSLIRNMIIGVTEGYQTKLEINGVGFKAAAQGSTKLVLNVGYSHPVNFDVPAGITVAVEANIITVSGIDKQQVGEIAAQIRKVKPVEPYKGKGIKYVGEVVRRKAGKAAAKAK